MKQGPVSHHAKEDIISQNASKKTKAHGTGGNEIMNLKPIKTITALLFAAALLLSLSACRGIADLTHDKDKAPAPAAYNEPLPEVQYNTEEYSAIKENIFLSANVHPFSTFAADVDTASYANLRRMILSGKKPPADAVRIEEMLNYFSYDYPSPEDDQPFSVTTELAPCPWNEQTDLLLIGLQAKKVDRSALPPSNLVFLIDVSGSMETPDKLPLAKRAFLLLLETLSPKDKISVVTYASSEKVILDGADISKKAEIMAAIDNLEAGGATDGSKGIVTAYDLAEKHFIKGGNNRVILATDGDLNVGITSEGELIELIEKERASGVYLSVLGFGSWNIKDNKMEALADHGNGNYSYIDTVAEARKVLVQERGGTLFTVAKDVKLQVEFNPAVVKGYRLIGYENRRMRAEEFDDDKKDGGEIGAGHSVTALYEIAKVDSAYEIPQVETRYGQPQGKNEKTALDEDEWLTVNIRYKEPDGAVSKRLTYPVTDAAFLPTMSENMSFAAGVAQFGMSLRSSPYLGSTKLSDVIRRLKALPSAATDDYKEELLYLMKKFDQTK